MTQQRSVETAVWNDYPDARSSSTGADIYRCDRVPAPNSGPKVDVSLTPQGHILLVLPPGEIVTGPMAAAANDEVGQLAGVKRLPMLLVLTGVEAITRQARTVFSNAQSMAAVAVLGVTPVDRVIANFLLGGTVQPCPTRYFSSQRDALDWLQRKNVA